VAEIEIGVYKSGRQAYGFDDIRHRPLPQDQGPRRRRQSPGRSTPISSACPSWARPWTGSSRRPRPSSSAGWAGSGCSTSRASGPAYEDPTRLFDEIVELDDEKATARMQEMYSEPVKLELVTSASAR